MREISLPVNLTLHFISPEPIQYVDISNKAVAGDLPLNNVLRIRLKDTSSAFTGAVITVAGEKFIAQYHLNKGFGILPGVIDIIPEDTRPLDIAGIGYSQNQLKVMALKLAAFKPAHKREKVIAFGITGKLNHVYTLGDYLFLDISYHNETNLNYNIAELRFKIEDKKITNAGNAQSFEIVPEFTLLQTPAFSKNYRNIFVFKKMSFPGNKVLLAELSEKRISGRIITLKVSYQDILDADILPN